MTGGGGLFTEQPDSLHWQAHFHLIGFFCSSSLSLLKPAYFVLIPLHLTSFHSILIFPLNFCAYSPMSPSNSTHLSCPMIPSQGNDFSTLDLLASRFRSGTRTLWTSRRLYYFTCLAIRNDNKLFTALNSSNLASPVAPLILEPWFPSVDLWLSMVWDGASRHGWGVVRRTNRYLTHPSPNFLLSPPPNRSQHLSFLHA